ncbi:hypothetical protein L1887_44556 [Cichorium endivia]|nr:hypothetical protein L1887_44556 [Cichorium endivia]
MFSLAKQLVEEGLVLDEDAVKKGAGGLLSAADGEDEEGNFDIAAVLVDGAKKHDDEDEERRRAFEANQGEGIDEAVLASITGEDRSARRLDGRQGGARPLPRTQAQDRSRALPLPRAPLPTRAAQGCGGCG